MRPVIDPEADIWLNGRQAGSIIGCASTALHRAGMLGHVRTKLVPGQAPRYHRADCERLARAKRQAKAKRRARTVKT
jgi:hypothetical protein